MSHRRTEPQQRALQLSYTCKRSHRISRGAGEKGCSPQFQDHHTRTSHSVVLGRALEEHDVLDVLGVRLGRGEHARPAVFVHRVVVVVG